jgi:signal transduction histidine kinase
MEILIDKQKSIAEQQLIAEQQSKELKKKIVLQQERERISRELHDDLGAQLSTARMFLNNLRAKDSTVDPSLVDHSLKLIENSISDLRVIMNDLHESTLREKGYIAATEELVNRINALQNIRFVLSHFGLPLLNNPKLEHLLFRITPELINNTLKYSGAKEIHLDIQQRDGQIIFFYEDNGSGFDPVGPKKGYGTKNIESRISSVGGTFSLDTGVGLDFRFIAELPYLDEF